MGRLLLLFVGLPAVELALLVEIGGRIGTLPTVGLIVLTGPRAVPATCLLPATVAFSGI